jgi:predicted outer membrane repeat protein
MAGKIPDSSSKAEFLGSFPACGRWPASGTFYTWGTITVSNTVFSGNSAWNGGAIASDIPFFTTFLTLSSWTPNGNTVVENGAIYNTISSFDCHGVGPIISNTTLNDNKKINGSYLFYGEGSQ